MQTTEDTLQERTNMFLVAVSVGTCSYHETLLSVSKGDQLTYHMSYNSCWSENKLELHDNCGR
jgi:hypothetical protein